MGSWVVLPEPRSVRVDAAPDPPLGPNDVRIATLYSGISAGTELAAYRGTNPYLAKRWDVERRLFRDDASASLSWPLEAPGYEQVGRVLEVGTRVDDARIAPGTLVHGTWGHRTHAVVPVEQVAWRTVPDGLDPILGIFAHIGAVALNGLLDARVRIGETVAVFGLGVPGQIVAQLARRSGVRVIGVDPIPARRETALGTGAAHEVLDPGAGDVAATIKDRTDGRGADVSIEVSGVAPALHEAIRATAYASRAIALGFYQGDAVGLRLGDEFHHNRVTVVSSQISGVDPELSGRWDRERLVRTAMALQADGTLDLRPLITHVVPFEMAADAFRLLDETPAEALQVVLRTEEADA